MMQYPLKIVISALIIVAASELAKRSALFGGLVASLPLVSILAIVWLYMDTKDTARVMALSTGIFWMVLPSLSLFLILPLLLKKEVPFYPAIIASCLLTAVIYASASWLYAKLGIKI